MKLPHIECAYCGKPVDQVEVYENLIDKTIVVSAYCHGMKDTMYLNLESMSYDEVRQLEGATMVAFTQDRMWLPC